MREWLLESPFTPAELREMYESNGLYDHDIAYLATLRLGTKNLPSPHYAKRWRDAAGVKSRPKWEKGEERKARLSRRRQYLSRILHDHSDDA